MEEVDTVSPALLPRDCHFQVRPVVNEKYSLYGLADIEEVLHSRGGTNFTCL